MEESIVSEITVMALHPSLDLKIANNCQEKYYRSTKLVK